jgi:hypothetical protein
MKDISPNLWRKSEIHVQDMRDNTAKQEGVNPPSDAAAIPANDTAPSFEISDPVAALTKKGY